MDQLSVMSIRLNDRDDIAPQVQEILTQNGDLILGRFGIHDPGETNHGLITLNLRGDMQRIQKMTEDLKKLKGVQVNHMQA